MSLKLLLKELVQRREDLGKGDLHSTRLQIQKRVDICLWFRRAKPGRVNLIEKLRFIRAAHKSYGWIHARGAFLPRHSTRRLPPACGALELASPLRPKAASARAAPAKALPASDPPLQEAHGSSPGNGRRGARVAEPAPSSELSRCLGPPLPWPPNKPERKRCIVSTRRTDRINLKSKGPLPAHPTPGLTPWPFHSSWRCFTVANYARARV